MLSVVLLVLFFSGLLFAAVHDLATMTIPNWVSIAFAVVFPAAALATGMSLPQIGLHYLAGIIGLVICIGLFSFGVFGGGDAKLLPAVLIWMGPSAWMQYVYGIALFGGLLALLFIITRRFVPRTVIPGVLKRSVVEGPGIPYAVAIGLGAIWAMPNSPVLESLISAISSGH